MRCVGRIVGLAVYMHILIGIESRCVFPAALLWNIGENWLVPCVTCY